MSKELVKVVIPIYQEKFTYAEKISIKQCRKVLKKYPICILKSSELVIQDEKDIENFEVEEFEERWFQSIQSYNQLMLSTEFYERFIGYEYILIYQLDAFVFRDELSRFCYLNYDYIGAPWLYGQFSECKGNEGYYYVGNGGFSLRKVKSHLQILKDQLTEENMNEDVFFASKRTSEFQVAPIEVALKFAFETNVRECYKKNGKKLPFGCHAWWKYDFEFYKLALEEMGYDTFDIKDEKVDYIGFQNNIDYSKIQEEDLKREIGQCISKFNGTIWVWGAGRKGKECGWLLKKNNIHIKGYVDKSISKQGDCLYEAKISRIEEYYMDKNNFPIIIAMKIVPEEVEELLKKNNKQEGVDYAYWKDIEQCLINMEISKRKEE